MAYKKTRKIQEKQESKRKAIIKAAKKILAEKTYAESSIKQIAKTAGIATGTFYLYFKNKDALIDTIIEETYTELLEHIKLKRKEVTSPFEKLEASMKACVEIFEKEKTLAKIFLIKLPGLNNALNERYSEIENNLISLVKKDLDELRLEGLIPEQDTLVSATAFVGTFRQVIIGWLKEGKPESLERAFETLMQYNMRGLGKEMKK